MCEPATLALFAAGTAAASTAVTTATAYQGARNQKAVANYNAQIAEQNAQDAERQGDEEASKVRRQYAQVGGQQRAGFAAKGIDFESGSAADALDQTDFFSQVDQGLAKSNADKAAWNTRAQKKGYEFQASSINPGHVAGATLLAGASDVAGKWYSYKSPAKKG